MPKSGDEGTYEDENITCKIESEDGNTTLAEKQV